MPLPTFGEKLQEFIDANETSAAEVADRLGIRAGTVSRWINNKRTPSFPEFLQLVRVLNVDPFLLAGSKFKEPKPKTVRRRAGRPARVTPEQMATAERRKVPKPDPDGVPLDPAPSVRRKTN